MGLRAGGEACGAAAKRRWHDGKRRLTDDAQSCTLPTSSCYIGQVAISKYPKWLLRLSAVELGHICDELRVGFLTASPDEAEDGSLHCLRNVDA